MGRNWKSLNLECLSQRSQLWLVTLVSTVGMYVLFLFMNRHQTVAIFDDMHTYNETVKQHIMQTPLNGDKSRNGLNVLSDCFRAPPRFLIGGTDRQLLKDTFDCTHLMALEYSNYGRTGTQMFKVASLLGIASYHGYTAVLDSSMLTIAALFDLPNMLEETKLIFNENTSRVFRETGCCYFIKRVNNISHDSNWTLAGFLQSWKYFEGAENIVRRAFRMKDNLTREARHFIKSTVSLSGTQTVSIHVRRGDFVDLYDKGFMVAPIQYIKRAMAYFRHKYENVHFFVVSNDKAWCKENLKGVNVTTSPFSTVGQDMALMVESDHVIVTSGSFGWWGAWLCGGETVYWTGHPRRGTWLGNQTTSDDFYPRHWIGLS